MRRCGVILGKVLNSSVLETQMDGLSTAVLESVHEWLLLRTVLEMLMKY